MVVASWTDPGAFAVADGVYRIPLPLPSDGLRAVNVYAILGTDSLTLIDGGWALEAAERALTAALTELGCELGDISAFLVTHVHRDHYTLPVRVRSRFGTPIYLGEGERPNIQALAEAAEGLRDVTQRQQLFRAGAAELVRQLAEPEAISAEDWLAPDDYLADRVLMPAGSRVLQTIATPGHTRGHVVFRDAEDGLLFAGDHVLPHITPSLGFEATAEPGALSRYLTSLRLLQTIPDTRLLPAHGDVADSVHNRIEELLDHHEIRLVATLQAVKDGCSTGLTAAARLCWTRHQRPFASLDLFNQTLAVCETLAHLEVLADRGELISSEAANVQHFHPA